MKTIKLKSTILLSLLTCFSYLKAQPVSFYIQAHEDDWQLFMSSQAMADINAGNKLVFITLTAGDAGYGDSTCTIAMNNAFYGKGIIPYYLSRENGSVFASKYAVDLLNNLNQQPGITPIAQTVTVSYTNSGGNKVTHNITKYVYKHTVNYFLRLPDGDIGGSGFPYPPDNGQSLQNLRSGIISSITAVDGSATYNGWNDLGSTFFQIVAQENLSGGEFWLNVPSLNDSNLNSIDYNPGDHSDHYHAAYLAWDTYGNVSKVGINGWVDYYSAGLLSNLIGLQFQFASELYGLCEHGKTQGGYTLPFHNAELVWLPMDYSKIQKTPGQVNASFIKAKKITKKK